MSLHYNGSDSFQSVDATKIYQFKANDSEIKQYPLCLGNVSKDCTIDNMKKAGLKGNVIFCCWRSINTNEIIDINKYLLKEML